MATAESLPGASPRHDRTGAVVVADIIGSTDSRVDRRSGRPPAEPSLAGTSWVHGAVHDRNARKSGRFAGAVDWILYADFADRTGRNGERVAGQTKRWALRTASSGEIPSRFSHWPWQ